MQQRLHSYHQNETLYDDRRIENEVLSQPSSHKLEGSFLPLRKFHSRTE